ncbi:MAG: cell division protein FtsZ [Pelagibacteraceae bacterium]
MAINISAPELRELKPRIVVLGVGGAGGNAINNMIEAGVQGVEFVAANTDAQALKTNKAECKIQLGANLTRGLGAGAKADIGQAAADESMNEIINLLQGSNMVFITAGMGGGTGTGAAPVIAKAARDLNILTVAVVTKPFMFEGPGRIRVAEAGLENLKKFVDTSIIIPNQNLFKIADEKTTFSQAFKMADNVLLEGVKGITDLIVKPGLINLDFADIETIMSSMGKAMMGTGEAEGENRAIMAADAALANPLIDDYSLKGAKGLLINITGGNDITLFEVDEAANKIRAEVDPAAEILVGSTFEENLNGKMKVSIVATGLGGEVAKNKPVVSMVRHIQNRHNGYSRPNVFNNQQSSFVMHNARQQQNYSSPAVSGANALDLSRVAEATTINQSIKTSYQDVYNDISNSYKNNLEEEAKIKHSSLKSPINPQKTELAVEDETPNLFTSDEDFNYSKSIKEENNIEKDLSSMEFDQESDLEIPAFLRRQTN